MSTSTVEFSRNGTGKGEANHDEAGRFRFGNPGGPGNPFARRVGELRRAMLEAVSAEDITAILQAMVVKAREGNVQAAKVVLSYTLGKPASVADPDRADAHEWELQRETAAIYPEMAKVSRTPPAEVPLRMARVLRPFFGGLAQGQVTDVLEHPGEFFAGHEEEGPSTNGEFGEAESDKQ